MEKDITDLLGCRYRAVQRKRFPTVAPTETSRQRAERAEEGRREALKLLPSGEVCARVDARNESDTQEAIAAGADLIVGAQFVVCGVHVLIDALVRTDGRYMPVVVSSHRVARPAKTAHQEVISTRDLGLVPSRLEAWKFRNHAADSYRLALADRALSELGVASGKGGAIGQDPELTFIELIAPLQHGLTLALETQEPDHPRRVKECRTCRYWFDCERQLRAADDITLLFSGDSSLRYVERGITTIQQLIEANLGESSQLARAWRAGIPVLRRGAVTMPRFDVEIDIDLEGYLDHGVYLWGTYDGRTYVPFVTWDALDSATEAQNFARFWSWLQGRIAKAKTRGQTIGVFCYSNNGENYWMRSSAKRFAGFPGVPSEQEVSEFLNSNIWIDVFRFVRTQLTGPEGLGLKIVARVAGFYWEGDLDGEASVHAYRKAFGEKDPQMREQLLRYNRDDCKATAVVRDWMSKGAPGIPILD